MSKNILHIISSVSGERSQSNKLSESLLAKLLNAYPGSSVRTHDLTKSPFPHLEDSHVAAFYTPAELQTDESRKLTKYSEEAIEELRGADIVVIGVPYYNFGIPSTLKAWLDHIVRVGLTFKYENGTPTGFLTDKKVYLAIASGGIYSEGPMKDHDFAEPYLRFTLGFVGLTDITTFRIEGTMIPDHMDTAWQDTSEKVDSHIF